MLLLRYATCLTIVSITSQSVKGVSLQIGGSIDLGQTFNYSYHITDVSKGKPKDELRRGESKDKYSDTSDDSIKSDDEEPPVGNMERVTHYSYEKYATPNDIYIEPHRIKYDAKIKEFTNHVYKQSLKMFESIKHKVADREMKKNVDVIMRSYEDKFGDFVRETQNQKIKTRLGTQKVLLNTVDTSNRILKRLLNYLVGEIEKKGALRNYGVAANVFHKELDKKIQLENHHICAKFQICRGQTGFLNFLDEVMTIVLSTDDIRIKVARDAFTEVLKATDYSHFLDADTEKRFLKGVSHMELFDATLTKAMFYIMKNSLASKNNPISVVGEADSRVNRTVAFIELLDMLETYLPPNEANLLAWNDIKSSFSDWKDGKRHDILEIVQTFVDHMKKPFDDLSSAEVVRLQKNFNIVLGY